MKIISRELYWECLNMDKKRTYFLESTFFFIGGGWMDSGCASGPAGLPLRGTRVAVRATYPYGIGAIVLFRAKNRATQIPTVR